MTRDDPRRHQAAVDLQQTLDRAVAAEFKVLRHAEQLEKWGDAGTQLLASQAVELAQSNEELKCFAYVAAHDLQERPREVDQPG